MTLTHAGVPARESQANGAPDVPVMPSPKFWPLVFSELETLVWMLVKVLPPSVDTWRYA